MEKTEAQHEQYDEQAERRALEHRQRLDANRMAELRGSAEQSNQIVDRQALLHRLENTDPAEARARVREQMNQARFTPDEIARIRTHGEGERLIEGKAVPRHYELLPDGREAEVVGDPEGCKQFNHLQGVNGNEFQNDCGLVSCEGVLNQFGKNVTEDEIVEYACEKHLCESDHPDARENGSATAEQVARVLNDYEVEAHVERGRTVENLADYVEEGKGVIIGVNAGELWNDARYYDRGEANHAVVVTGVAHDTETGEIQGFFINDSGAGESGKFVDVNVIRGAWEDNSAKMVVTAESHY